MFVSGFGEGFKVFWVYLSGILGLFSAILRYSTLCYVILSYITLSYTILLYIYISRCFTLIFDSMISYTIGLRGMGKARERARRLGDPRIAGGGPS